jgi:hypothetical protein
MHVFVAELANSNAPAWIDEGLGMIWQGGASTRMVRQFREFLAKNRPLALSSLNSNFLLLSQEQIKPAYTQSLFAVRTLVNRFGFQKIKNFLIFLSRGKDSAKAFADAFGISQGDFEKDLQRQLEIWRKSGSKKL